MKNNNKWILIASLVWLGVLIVLSLVYYTDFRLCQGGGALSSFDGTIPCTLSNEIFYPFFVSAFFFVFGYFITIPALIITIIGFLRAKNKVQFTFIIVLIVGILIDGTLLVSYVKEIPLLIKQAQYPVNVNLLLPSYLPNGIGNSAKYSSLALGTQYPCVAPDSSPYSNGLMISQSRLGYAQIFNIDQYEKDPYAPYRMQGEYERVPLINTTGLYVNIGALIFFTKDSMITLRFDKSCNIPNIKNLKQELINVANSMQ